MNNIEKDNRFERMIILSIVRTIKESDKSVVAPNEEFKMTLEIWAEPSYKDSASDSVLILDISGSMIENGIEEMKEAACRYTDIILKNNGENCDSNKNSKISVVSFNDRGHIELPLSDNAEEIKETIRKLQPKGYTNHADAFKKAYEVMLSAENKKKTAVLFTDGDSTICGDIEGERKKLLTLGTEIYTVALGTPLSVRASVVKSWASEVKEGHFFLIEEKEKLEEAFKKIAEETAKSFSRNISIFEKLRDDFIITKITEPSKGTVERKGNNSLSWKIPVLGKDHREGAKLNFCAEYRGCGEGIVKINDFITCVADDEECITFPDPVIEIKRNCDPGYKEPGNPSIDAEICPCDNSLVVNGDNLEIMSGGRIITVNLKIKNVCPGKRLALGVILLETDPCHNEEERGVKTILIPAHHENECRDITVKCIEFAVPEELSLNKNKDSICGKRYFKIKTIINYVDTDYEICK